MERELDLIVTMDDATSAIYSAFLVEEEGTMSSFWALAEVIGAHGLPCALYTDRASHYFHTPKAGAKVAKDQPTQVGRALAQLVDMVVVAGLPPAALTIISLKNFADPAGMALVERMGGMTAREILDHHGVEHPDLQYHFLPLAINYDGSHAYRGHGFQAHVGPMRPTSVGAVRLRSADPREPPEAERAQAGGRESLLIAIGDVAARQRRPPEMRENAPRRGGGRPPRLYEQGREDTELVKVDGRWLIKRRYISSDSGAPDRFDETYEYRENPLD